MPFLNSLIFWHLLNTRIFVQDCGSYFKVSLYCSKCFNILCCYMYDLKYQIFLIFYCASFQVWLFITKYKADINMVCWKSAKFNPHCISLVLKTLDLNCHRQKSHDVCFLHVAFLHMTGHQLSVQLLYWSNNVLHFTHTNTVACFLLYSSLKCKNVQAQLLSLPVY